MAGAEPLTRSVYPIRVTFLLGEPIWCLLSLDGVFALAEEGVKNESTRSPAAAIRPVEAELLGKTCRLNERKTGEWDECVSCTPSNKGEGFPGLELNSGWN